MANDTNSFSLETRPKTLPPRASVNNGAWLSIRTYSEDKKVGSGLLTCGSKVWHHGAGAQGNTMEVLMKPDSEMQWAGSDRQLVALNTPDPPALVPFALLRKYAGRPLNWFQRKIR